MTRTDPSDSTWRAAYNAQLHSILSGTALKLCLVFQPTIRAMTRYNPRQDEYDVDFDNTRDHAVLRWREMILGATESLSSQIDRQTVQESREWSTVADDIQEKASNQIYNAQMRRILMGIQPLPRTLSNLTDTFETALTPHTVELNILWGLLYLNVKASIPKLSPLGCQAAFMLTLQSFQWIHRRS
jgi:hypothetical protein